MSTYDYEKQKLAKIFVELVQKQYVFDEILKVIEEEKIDIQQLFLTALDRVKYQARNQHL